MLEASCSLMVCLQTGGCAQRPALKLSSFMAGAGGVTNEPFILHGQGRVKGAPFPFTIGPGEHHWHQLGLGPRQTEHHEHQLGFGVGCNNRSRNPPRPIPEFQVEGLGLTVSGLGVTV